MIISDILKAVGNTPIVKLNKIGGDLACNLYGKCEFFNAGGSVKDRIGVNMIEKAEQAGNLHPNVTILEPTSGNTGISLALVGRLKGYKITVVMPDNVSPERTQLLKAYGAEIIYSEGRYGSNGAIELAQEIMSKEPNGNYFMLYQYGNNANPEAHYKTTGAEIVQALPEVGVFIAGLGTGGTLMGVGRRLKEHRPTDERPPRAPRRSRSLPRYAGRFHSMARPGES